MSNLLIGRYNSAAPTLVDTYTGELQLDINGNLKVAGSLTVDSEFPAAGALADATSNPTTTTVGAMNEFFNGTTWDRGRSGQTSNSATVTGFQNVLGMARYNATPTARTEGQFGNFQSDANGNLQSNLATTISGENQSENVLGIADKYLATNTYTASATQNNSFQTTNIKASAGCVLGLNIINTTTTDRYFQIHNTATTPGGGATALRKYIVGAGSQIILGPKELGANGIYCSTGIAIANSTVLSTYTAGTSGDLTCDITWI